MLGLDEVQYVVCLPVCLSVCHDAHQLPIPISNWFLGGNKKNAQ